MKKSKKGDDLITFYWDVPLDGFQWVEAREVCLKPIDQSHLAPEKRWLVPLPSTQQRVNRRYGPLTEEPALFRTFAETFPTEEGIQRFSSKYGWLGIPRLVLPQEELNLIEEQLRFAKEGKKLEAINFSEALSEPCKGVIGESLETWEEAIWRIHFALSLWDAIQSNDVEQLKRFIVFQEGVDGNGYFVYRSSEEVSDYCETAIIDDILHEIPVEARALARRGHVIHLALIVVQKLVSEQILAHAGPALLYEGRKDRLNLSIVPKNLIGGMWLQFARSIDGNKNYHQCRQCGKWFEISLEANRPTRFYCNDGPCRSRSYRRRKDTAQELYSEGISIKEIAQRLEMNAATVQGWIATPAARRHNRTANS